jgi:hypothetical protein
VILHIFLAGIFVPLCGELKMKTMCTILRFVLIIFSCQGVCYCLAILVSGVREIQNAHICSES